MKFLDQVNKVIVLGCGGTGSILIPQLCRYLYSLRFKGKIIFCDGDEYTDGNKDRQTFSNKFVGKNKAEYQAMAILSQLPELTNNIEFVDEYLDKDKIEEMVSEGTIVLNCVDNRAARKYVEDQCLKLKNVAHICCGNELVNGQVQMSYRRDGKQITPSIYVRSPKFNDTNDDRAKMDCVALAALPGGGQLVCANMMAASLALNFCMQILGKDKILQDNYWVPCGIISFDCRQNNFLREDVNELAEV